LRALNFVVPLRALAESGFIFQLSNRALQLHNLALRFPDLRRQYIDAEFFP
jgi:hypothetical protein